MTYCHIGLIFVVIEIESSKKKMNPRSHNSQNFANRNTATNCTTRFNLMLYPLNKGVLTQKNQKKTVATPKSVNWHWFFWFFWFFFWFFKIPKLALAFLVFFLVFFCFLALVLARIRNWKLVFWALLVFLLVFFGFFWDFLISEFRVRIPSQEKQKTKKKQKKTSRSTKIGKLAWFFLVFLG